MALDRYKLEMNSTKARTADAVGEGREACAQSKSRHACTGMLRGSQSAQPAAAAAVAESAEPVSYGALTLEEIMEYGIGSDDGSPTAAAAQQPDGHYVRFQRMHALTLTHSPLTSRGSSTRRLQ
jgi:hypothetical protein